MTNRNVGKRTMALKPFETMSQNYRNLKRTQEIINVFIKHGFGDWWGRVKTDGRVMALLEKVSAKPMSDQEAIPMAKRMRLALEELGPTFVKMGQRLSTRPDLIPVAFVEEFALLQSRVPPLRLRRLKTRSRPSWELNWMMPLRSSIANPWFRLF